MLITTTYLRWLCYQMGDTISLFISLMIEEWRQTPCRTTPARHHPPKLHTSEYSHSRGAHRLPAPHTLRNQTLHNPQAAQEFPAGGSPAGFAGSKLLRSKEDEVGAAAKGVVGFSPAKCREWGCVCVCVKEVRQCRGLTVIHKSGKPVWEQGNSRYLFCCSNVSLNPGVLPPGRTQRKTIPLSDGLSEMRKKIGCSIQEHFGPH